VAFFLFVIQGIDTSMSSFGEFLEERMSQDVSKEGQISQYEKSLDRLGKVRTSLSKNGMDTTDVERQMHYVHHALGRRRSGTHKWHGAIVRIDQEPRNRVMMWRLISRDGKLFHIPVDDAQGVIKIPYNWNQYPSSKKPMNKFIEYREEAVGSQIINLITYAENRTVDVVPFRTIKDKSEFYLIKRRDSGLWATVGGHIEEGELENPIVTARRELYEETKCYPMVLRQIPSGWIREVVADPDLNPAKEYNCWVMPYVAIVHPDTVMDPSDDAVGGAWFPLDHVPDVVHFAHHRRVIKQAVDFLPSLLKQFGKY
jgi:8-oxo-dGTP pyrophosphatase MutT (NUDIX family)